MGAAQLRRREQSVQPEYPDRRAAFDPVFRRLRIRRAELPIGVHQAVDVKIARSHYNRHVLGIIHTVSDDTGSRKIVQPGPPELRAGLVIKRL